MRIFDPIKPNQDPAGQLAEMVVNTVYEDIPKEVIERDELQCVVLVGIFSLPIDLLRRAERIKAILANEAEGAGHRINIGYLDVLRMSNASDKRCRSSQG